MEPKDPIMRLVSSTKFTITLLSKVSVLFQFEVDIIVWSVKLLQDVVIILLGSVAHLTEGMY